MGLVVEPGFSYYPPITIGDLYKRAMRDRYIEPRFPISSTGLGLVTWMPVPGADQGTLPREWFETDSSEIQAALVEAGGIDTNAREAYTEIIQSLKDQNLPIPDWLQPYMKYLPGWEDSPEHSEEAEVSSPAISEEIVTKPENKSVKYLLLGGAALVAFMALRGK